MLVIAIGNKLHHDPSILTEKLQLNLNKLKTLSVEWLSKNQKVITSDITFWFPS